MTTVNNRGLKANLSVSIFLQKSMARWAHFNTICLYNTVYYSAVRGKWSQWSDVSLCSKTCGIGSKASIRICNNPAPTNGGDICEGEARNDKKACNIHLCPGILSVCLKFKVKNFPCLEYLRQVLFHGDW